MPDRITLLHHGPMGTSLQLNDYTFCCSEGGRFIRIQTVGNKVFVYPPATETHPLLFLTPENDHTDDDDTPRFSLFTNGETGELIDVLRVNQGCTFKTAVDHLRPKISSHFGTGEVSVLVPQQKVFIPYQNLHEVDLYAITNCPGNFVSLQPFVLAPNGGDKQVVLAEDPERGIRLLYTSTDSGIFLPFVQGGRAAVKSSWFPDKNGMIQTRAGFSHCEDEDLLPVVKMEVPVNLALVVPVRFCNYTFSVWLKPNSSIHEEIKAVVSKYPDKFEHLEMMLFHKWGADYKEYCRSCGRSGSNLPCCRKCKSFHYCDIVCRNAGWEFHKQFCHHNMSKGNAPHEKKYKLYIEGHETPRGPTCWYTWLKEASVFNRDSPCVIHYLPVWAPEGGQELRRALPLYFAAPVCYLAGGGSSIPVVNLNV